jgi:DNA-directed RNA polymerase specialized sigma24 family protein
LIGAEREALLLAGLRGVPEERERALAELFERTRTGLFALALRMTGRPDLADDAVQETFVDVLRGAAGMRGEARLTTWLYRVAVRAAARVAARARHRAGPLPEQMAARPLSRPKACPSARGPRASSPPWRGFPRTSGR